MVFCGLKLELCAVELPLLVEEISCRRELNSRDSSSAVAKDAFRSSVMDRNSMLLPKLLSEDMISGSSWRLLHNFRLIQYTSQIKRPTALFL